MTIFDFFWFMLIYMDGKTTMPEYVRKISGTKKPEGAYKAVLREHDRRKRIESRGMVKARARAARPPPLYSV